MECHSFQNVVRVPNILYIPMTSYYNKHKSRDEVIIKSFIPNYKAYSAFWFIGKPSNPGLGNCILPTNGWMQGREINPPPQFKKI